MNTAKHLNGSNLQHLPKKRFRFWNKSYLPVMLLAVLLGTLLDIYFTGENVYQYPVRPFPELFSFNIGFTFAALPLFVILYLHLMDRVNGIGKAALILFFSLLAPIFEKMAEVCGLFEHSPEWKHSYSFAGYFWFLIILFLFYQWIERRRG